MTTHRNVWRLRKRPVGDIKEGDLTYEREALPELTDGQFLLEVLYLSLDPTNRIWMSDMRQYMPPVPLDAPMRGGVAGRVVASKKPGVKEGDIYFGLGEFADYIVTDGSSFTKAELPAGLPLSVGYGIFGLVGPTAYFGLLHVGKPKEGETLVVSAASGGVGQIVGQIGKIKGLHVIGIAGGPEKCRYLTDELGFDAAIDYKNEDVGKQLDALAPKGVDINFEQVGGPIMEAVMSRMNLFGRMPLCGMISGYNNEKPAPGPRTWPLILMQRLTVQGFIICDFIKHYDEMFRELGGWIAEGRIKTRQDVRKGLENAIDYLGLLYTGGNTGKLLVEVHPDAGKL
jgi:NADPH-dependent curcumin reductase